MISKTMKRNSKNIDFELLLAHPSSADAEELIQSCILAS
jgi:hypothetical protein